jgi:hypothetical protein
VGREKGVPSLPLEDKKTKKEKAKRKSATGKRRTIVDGGRSGDVYRIFIFRVLRVKRFKLNTKRK